jgi:serine/threonine-protein kinase
VALPLARARALDSDYPQLQQSSPQAAAQPGRASAERGAGPPQGAPPAPSTSDEGHARRWLIPATVGLVVLVVLAGALLLRSSPHGGPPRQRGSLLVPGAGSIKEPLLRAARAASKAPRGGSDVTRTAP